MGVGGTAYWLWSDQRRLCSAGAKMGGSTTCRTTIQGVPPMAGFLKAPCGLRLGLQGPGDLCPVSLDSQLQIRVWLCPSEPPPTCEHVSGHEGLALKAGTRVRSRWAEAVLEVLARGPMLQR